jgi:hypothetical protein
MVRNPRWTLTQEATLALAISAAFPASAFAAEVARVQFAAGQASATTADGRVRTLARGADINEGDTVNTEQGRVQLKFRDGALVSLQPRTAFRIDEYAFRGTADGSEKGFFSLLRGGLRTITGLIGRSNSDSYRVRTQTATIGIRGTEYIAQVGNSLNVSVGGGRIALTNDAGTFIIEQGQSAYVADSKSLPIVQLQKPVLSPQGTNEGTEAPQPKREVVAGEGSNAATPGESTSPPVEPSAHIGAFVWDGGSGLSASTGNATLDGTQLTAFTDPSSGTAYAKGTTTVHDASFDNTIGVARWSNGTFTVTPEGGATQQVAVGANQGFHAVFGTPTPTMPTSAVATYGLLAATQATSSDGSLGLGTVAAAQGAGQPILAVDFASGRVGTDFTVSFTDRAYRVTTTGGILDVTGSEVRLLGASAPNVFANVLAVPTTAVSGNACMNDGCAGTDVLGFFAGDNATRAGFTYRITDDALKVNGAVATGPAVTGSALTSSINPVSAAFTGPHEDASYETFVGAGSGSLDTSNRLTAFTGTNEYCCSGTMSYSTGTATFAQSSYDGVIGFGRLANGTASLDGGEGGGAASLGNGLHVAFGAPTASTQLSALASSSTPTVTYSLLGATSATATHLPGVGTVTAAQGTGQPILSVNFATGTIGVDFKVSFASANWGYRVTSTGGVYDVSNSQITLQDAQSRASFVGSSVPTTAIDGDACTGSGGCSTDIRGFFAGTDASRAGFTYRIRDRFEVEDEGTITVTEFVYGAVTATAATPQAALLTPSTAVAVVSGNGNGGNTFSPDIFGGEGTASLNTSGQMINFAGTNSICCGPVLTQQGTATLAESGYDGIVGYGRFSNGSVTVDGAEGSGAGTTVLSANQGLHYAFGSPLATLPSTPVIAQYSLLGATKATSDNGSLGLGTLSGSLAVDFQSQKVGVDLSVAFNDPSSTRYHMMTTGGTSSVLASELQSSNNPAAFANNLPVVRSLSGGPEIACSSGCYSYVHGFFSGSSAERAGLGYRIFDSDTGNGISGTGTFGQTSTVPLLTGTGIALNFAGAIDTAPPTNNSDAFKHLGTTGTIDGTNALAAINAGGNTTIGTAGVHNAARDDVIGWARWSGGTLGGTGTYGNSALTGNLSFHGVYGTPTSASDMAALQTAFVGLGATYTLIGGTAPTDATGGSAPGFLNSGSLTAWFGTQTVDVNLGVTAASRTFSVAATNLPISGSGFGGTTSNVSASGCSACTANIQGFFAGSMAARAGVSYSIKDFGSTLVNGAAGFTRTGTVTQPDS